MEVHSLEGPQGVETSLSLPFPVDWASPPSGSESGQAGTESRVSGRAKCIFDLCHPRAAPSECRLSSHFRNKVFRPPWTPRTGLTDLRRGVRDGGTLRCRTTTAVLG